MGDNQNDNFRAHPTQAYPLIQFFDPVTGKSKTMNLAHGPDAFKGSKVHDAKEVVFDEEIDITSGIYIGEAGDLEVTFAESNESVVLEDVQAGSVHPFAVKEVHEEGTTAEGIVLVY